MGIDVSIYRLKPAKTTLTVSLIKDIVTVVNNYSNWVYGFDFFDFEDDNDDTLRGNHSRYLNLWYSEDHYLRIDSYMIININDILDSLSTNNCEFVEFYLTKKPSQELIDFINKKNFNIIRQHILADDGNFYSIEPQYDCEIWLWDKEFYSFLNNDETKRLFKYSYSFFDHGEILLEYKAYMIKKYGGLIDEYDNKEVIHYFRQGIERLISENHNKHKLWYLVD